MNESVPSPAAASESDDASSARVLLATTPLSKIPRFDPEQIPFDPTFADPAQRGSAPTLAHLEARALRQRFSAPPAWQPEVTADARLEQAVATPRPAAVLVPLVSREEGLSVLLTRRTAHLHDHAGQISFPGGRFDAGDRDIVHTALREAQEEIGLNPQAVDVIGQLPLYVTVTGYAVTPVVGLIEHAFTPQLDHFEVDEAFEVPFAFLMDPANHERRRIDIAGVSRNFYAMPYERDGRRYFIWGATAAMLRNLYHFVRA